MKWLLPMSLFLPSPVKSDKVLLVRDDHIGDLVYRTSASVKWMVDNHYDVYLVIRKEFLCIGKLLLPEHKLVPLDYRAYRTSLKYRWQFAKMIRKLGVGIAVGSVTHSSINSDIVRNSGAAVKYGCQHIYSFRERFRLRGLRLVKIPPLMKGESCRPVIENEKILLSQAFSATISQLYSFIHPIQKQKLPPCLPNRKYIAYIADASDPKRSYPPNACFLY